MIKTLIDEAIAHWERLKLNCHPGKIPHDMVTSEAQDDWVFWRAIPSTVTTADLAELERELGVKFSPQYRELLLHRHFIELHVGEVSLFRHSSDEWKKEIRKPVFGGYPKGLLIEKGYLPFANFSDWGLWCFGLNKSSENGEYPIYLWDHDRPEEFRLIARDLVSALQNQKTTNND